MGKYEPLSDHLQRIGRNHVLMTFEDIEKVLGFPLPASSRKHRAWWSNNPSNNVMTHAWLEAGYRTEDVDIERRRLVFRRTVADRPGPAAEEPPTAAGEEPPEGAPHPLYGCLRGTVTFIGDVDLTRPADPDWGGYEDTVIAR